MRSRNVVAVEMEAAALFYLAMRERGRGKDVRGACILTVSDTLVKDDESYGADYMPLAELERRRMRMIEIALEAGTASDRMIPIGINLTSIGVSSKWWLEAAEAVEAAGFAGVWCWDHFISQGKDKTMPVLESWTTLTAVAARTSRLRVGSFVTNVMNRHPAVLARMLATISDQSGGAGRSGHRRRRQSRRDGGIRHQLSQSPAERVAVLEEAVAVMRAPLVGRPGRLRGAVLPAARCVRRAGTQTRAADHRRRRKTSRAPDWPPA